MTTRRYVICAAVGTPEDNTGHEPLLFWNNEYGFGSLSTATVFTEDEARRFDLPFADDQPEWVELPSCS